MLFYIADNSSSNRLLEYYSDGCIEYEVTESEKTENINFQDVYQMPHVA